MSASLPGVLLLVATRWLPASVDSLPKIEEVSEQFASAPVIAVTSGGATLLAWEQADTPGGQARGIFVRRREAGEDGRWSAWAMRLDDGPPGVRALEPRLAVAGERAILAWQDDRAGRSDVHVRTSPDAGLTWPSRAARLDGKPEGSSISSMTSIQANDAGWIAAAWEDTRGGTRDVYFRRSADFGATWSGETRIDDDGSHANGASYHPQVALTNDGAVVVVWWDEAHGLSDVMMRRGPEGGARWEAPVRLDAGDPGVAASRDVGLAVRGSTIALAWEDETGGAGRETVARASLDAGRTWSPVARFARPQWARAIEDPRVALDDGGRAHMVWVAEPSIEAPINSDFPRRAPKRPALRLEPTEALVYAVIEPDSAAAPTTRIAPGTVPSAAPHSRLAWIGSGERILWLAWVGTRVDSGGIDIAWTGDDGRTWRTIGLAPAQNPEGAYVPVTGLTGAVDATGSLHLAWVQGRPGRERVRFARISNPMAPENRRE
jgi:hypothetical protein